jgi:hypothetical protein
LDFVAELGSLREGIRHTLLSGLADWDDGDVSALTSAQSSPAAGITQDDPFSQLDTYSAPSASYFTGSSGAASAGTADSRAATSSSSQQPPPPQQQQQQSIRRALFDFWSSTGELFGPTSGLSQESGYDLVVNRMITLVSELFHPTIASHWVHVAAWLLLHISTQSPRYVSVCVSVSLSVCVVGRRGSPAPLT